MRRNEQELATAFNTARDTLTLTFLRASPSFFNNAPRQRELQPLLAQARAHEGIVRTRITKCSPVPSPSRSRRGRGPG